ncbi:SLC13 family permease [Desulfoscipio gibsoniae]|uniref:Di-/tricarboxylate transporter n=1 Tax=Desulfoscipio gibsoniae DSM 7213 TaxID=767817 RepID=R4KJ71_9FIRM|nr:SLC13 family permease [Desulfoscipio gibsoniae]AGL03268.1 di-/tricarboxylate transporter [Desulfoscipio gibsoniae DSM 7213]
MFKDTRVLGVAAFALIGLFIGIAKPFVGLPAQGHFIMATVIAALGFWIFRPGGLPFSAGCSLILAGGLIFGLKYDVVASGFVSSAVWVLIPALYFGFILQKTGLGKRIAYLVLKSFKPSWLSMAFSWFIIGIALSALTPSITVRIAIVMPIALSVVEACKQEYRSKGSAFIALLAWAMCLFPGTGWLTGSLSGPIILGFLPPELKPMATFEAWFQILALPWLLITVIFTVLVYFIMKPKEAIGIPRDTFEKEYADLGPIRREEIIAIIVLVGSLVMFSTERIHHIPTAATALAALFLLIMFKLITVPEISSGINWDVVMFFGVAISLQTIFVASQVSGWIEPILRPSLLSLASNPLIFLLVATFGIMLIRFIDVPWGFSTAALTITVLIPIYTQFGIHPLVSSMAYLIGINFVLLNYQQPFILISEGIMQNRGWAPVHVTLAGVAYIIAAVIALLVSMPYWRMIGVIQ